MKNTVCHVEIPVLDLEKAKKFYETIFDWKVDLECLPDYGMIDFGNESSVGLFKADTIPESLINVYFEVADIDDTLEQVEASGGKIVKGKTLIAPELGYSARFQDCFGNELGLHSRS
ncbi:MAG: VOC family protein [Candidatus Odinarchaeota archaeon]